MAKDVVYYSFHMRRYTHIMKIKITGSGFLLFLLTFCLLFAGRSSAEIPARLQQPRTDCPTIGAIRWDAWHGSLGEVGMAVEKSLGPEQWHYRVPFCGRIVARNEVDIECASQEIMDQEIKYAAGAGLGYWAFLVYDERNPMSFGLKYYLSSKYKNMINFSIITNPRNWGESGDATKAIERYIRLMKEPSYQKVASGRPLIFIGFIDERRMKNYSGGKERLKTTLMIFRKKAIEAGIGNPYIVVMDFSPERASRLANEYNFDAISAYATNNRRENAPYSELVRHTEEFWERSKRTGAQVIPLAMAGWDDRPRAENPAPWQMYRREKLGKSYYHTATPEELASHVADAILWVRRNAIVSSAGIVLIYAWNEHDEGGWLAPTLSEKDARLLKLSEKLKLICPNK